MSRMKYIMLEHGPVIFSEAYVHSEMAQGRRVLSAGFVNINEEGKFYAYGESISLDIKSDPRDSDLINKEFHSEW